MVARDLASPNDIPQPPKAYALYEQVRAWNFQHLPLAGGHYDQPYLVMRQLAAVMSGIELVNAPAKQAEAEAENEIKRQLQKLAQAGLTR